MLLVSFVSSQLILLLLLLFILLIVSSQVSVWYNILKNQGIMSKNETLNDSSLLLLIIVTIPPLP